jgi:hypothetical protein
VYYVKLKSSYTTLTGGHSQTSFPLGPGQFSFWQVQGPPVLLPSSTKHTELVVEQSPIPLCS